MLKQHTVLIVDDEDSFLSSIARALRKEPYSLELASSGLMALQILEEKEINIIVTDLKMPGMDGLELLKIVRSRYPNVMTIILTAVQELDVAMRAINDLRVHKFFLKPLELNSFKAATQLALEAMCPFLDLKSRYCQCSRYGLFIPLPSHYTAYCHNINHIRCPQYSSVKNGSDSIKLPLRKGTKERGNQVEFNRV